MPEKRKMSPFSENNHNLVRDYLEEIRKKTGAKITISSFVNSAAIEKIQRDKYKPTI